MTNRQIAAKLVAKGLADLKKQISEIHIKEIASAGGKHHTSHTAADKVRIIASKLIDPWVERMEKLNKPRAKKAKDGSGEDQAPQPEPAGAAAGG